MSKPRAIKIPKTDTCEYCGHQPTEGSDGKPVIIYSKARAEWLEKGANDLMSDGGFLSDDGLVDWYKEHKTLLKKGE